MSQTTIVINKCYGGFNLSDAAIVRLAELGSPYVRKMTEEEREHAVFNDSGYLFQSWDIPRHDKLLIQVINELGAEAASGTCSELKVLTIPGHLYKIEEYDGLEHVDTPATIHWVDATEAPAGVVWS